MKLVPPVTSRVRATGGRSTRLARAVFGTRAEFGHEGILPEVEPFLAVTLSSAKLAVEKIFLPDRFLVLARPLARRGRTPEFHPLFQQCGGHHGRRAEEMDVLRHDDVAADKPVVGESPSVQDGVHGIGAVDQRAAFVHVDGDEDALVDVVVRWVVRQRATSRVAVRSLHG